jgi:hypothetical protein
MVMVRRLNSYTIIWLDCEGGGGSDRLLVGGSLNSIVERLDCRVLGVGSADR